MRRIVGYAGQGKGYGFVRPIDLFDVLANVISAFAWHADQDAWACPLASNFTLDASVQKFFALIAEMTGRQAIAIGVDDLMRARLLGASNAQEGTIGATLMQLFNLLTAQSEEIRDVGEFVRLTLSANGWSGAIRTASCVPPHPAVTPDTPLTPDDDVLNWFLLPSPSPDTVKSLVKAFVIIDSPSWGLNIFPPLPSIEKSETQHAFGEKPAGQSEGFKLFFRAAVALGAWYLLQPTIYWARAHSAVVHETAEALRSELNAERSRIAGASPESYDSGTLLHEMEAYLVAHDKVAKLPCHALSQGALSCLKHNVQTEIGEGPMCYTGNSDPKLEELLRYVQPLKAISDDGRSETRRSRPEFDIREVFVKMLTARRTAVEKMWATFSGGVAVQEGAPSPFAKRAAGGLGPMWDPRSVLDALANLSISLEDIAQAASRVGVTDVPASNASSWTADFRATGVEWTDGHTMSAPISAAVAGLVPIAPVSCVFAASQGPQFVAEFGITESSSAYTSVPLVRQRVNERIRAYLEHDWMLEFSLMGEEVVDKILTRGSDIEALVLDYWVERFGLEVGEVLDDRRKALGEVDVPMRYFAIDPAAAPGLTVDADTRVRTGIGALSISVEAPVRRVSGSSVRAQERLALKAARDAFAAALNLAKCGIKMSQAPFVKPLKPSNGRFAARLQKMRAFAYDGLTYCYRVEPRGALLVDLNSPLEADFRFDAADITAFSTAVTARFTLRGDMKSPREAVA